MVFRERRPLNPEREALLSKEDPYHGIRRSILHTVNWKSSALCLLAGLIPILLWFAILQSYSDPTIPTENTSRLLQMSYHRPATTSRFNSHHITPEKSSPLPVLKSIRNSPNWRKISKKWYRKNKTKDPLDAHAPKEFGTYPPPTFTQAGSKIITTYHLIVTNGVLSPDGFPQPAYLINGQSPGPEIRVKLNSILIVHVENRLNKSITFHFHGIHQRKSFLSDGVPHVTQNAIPPGGSFTHVTNLWPQVGTFFYHAHTSMDIVWLYGPLIIEDEPQIYKTFPSKYQYDEDKVFILNGVYHEEMNALVDRINGPIHNYPALINSITINGRSFGEWVDRISGKVFSAPTSSGYDITTVKKGLRYRFRFINAASDSLLSCNISSHNFTVIEMDGIYTEPVETDHVALSPGQRYSVIITMNQEDDNYFIACRHLESQGPLNGLAVLNYFNATKPTQEMLEYFQNGSLALDMDRWIVDDLIPNESLNQTDLYQVPSHIDKEYFIDVFETSWNERRVYLINGHHYEDPEVPYYQQLQNGVNITDIPQVFEVLEGEKVQFVFQNTRTGTFCFSHPWHIHGHTFHVVGEGPNKYDPVVDGARIQLDIDNGKKFQFRDSVTVYANQTVGEMSDGAYCGWVAVRFSAHNNGLWFAHCHVTPHLIMGKKFVIWEHSEGDPMLAELMSANYNYSNPGEPGGW